MKSRVWEYCRLIGAGFLILILLCVSSIIYSFITGSTSDIMSIMRSLTLGAGGIFMLIGAIGLLVHPSLSKKKEFTSWKKLFPNVSITSAILMVSVQLILWGCLLDYTNYMHL